MKFSHCARRTVLALTLAVLAACATQPPDHGVAQARETLLARGLDSSLEDAPFRGELSRPQAVRAALLYHPSVRAEYARLELAAADIVRASELLNPSLSLSWLDISGGGNELRLGLAQSLAAVMLRPARQRIAAADYELAVLELADTLQALALATESAWYALVAAEQELQVQTLAADTARWADELGTRFAAAGNMTPLQRAELARDAAEARLELLHAERQRNRARAQLDQRLALPHEDWSVPDSLPLPASDAPDLERLVAAVLETHPALQRLGWERQRLLSVGDNARGEGWLDGAEAGVERERSGGESATGPGVTFRLPFWHRNPSIRLALAAELELLAAREASLRDQLPRQLRLQLIELSRLRSAVEVREQALLPALAGEVQARQERVNFMLDGVFNLLASKQSELNAWREHVATLGEYWQQEVELARTAGRASTPAGAGTLDISSIAPVGKAEQEHGPDENHQHHGAHH